MNNQSILITGASGFIGTNLSIYFAKSGCDVHILVRNNSKIDQFKSYSNIFVHIHDGSYKSLVDIISISNPYVVFHLASLYLVQHNSSDITQLLSSNLIFGTHLVEAMTSLGYFNLVNVGSSWQNFNSSVYNPVNLYAASKQAFETLLVYFSDALGLNVVTIKLCDTYGLYDNRKKIVNTILDSARSNNVLTLSPGDQLLDLLYVNDVINGFVIASERFKSRSNPMLENFSLSSNAPISLRHLVDVIEDLLHLKIPIIWGGREYREREVMIPSVGELLPNWNPKISLTDGLKILIDNSF